MNFFIGIPTLILVIVLMFLYRKYNPLFDIVIRQDEVVLLIWYTVYNHQGVDERAYKEIFSFKRR